MAKATAVTKQVITGVALELTTEEAEFLADAFSHVSGDPDNTRRKHQEAISIALGRVGIRFDIMRNKDIEGGLRCSPKKVVV